MQHLLKQLSQGTALTPAQIAEATAFLVDPQPSPEIKATFLKALHAKGETAEEITGFVNEFLKLAVDPGLDPKTLPGPMLDVVGTGGDKLHLFNVSTTAMFIMAAGGVCIVKHGNRGITSKAGGADVLEALGVKIDLPTAKLAECVRTHGAGFLFAPQYHPTFAAVREARALLAKEGSRSIFNILGPLLNPARPDYQLVGVFDPALTKTFGNILQKLGRKAAWVVHGHTEDGRGMDELSTLGPNNITELRDGTVKHTTLRWPHHGKAHVADLAGGDAAENADILEGILANRIDGPKRDMAVLNAAAGFVITGLAKDIPEGAAQASELLDRGAAHVKLRELQDFC
jgi:anthranilate phosphoribosyltransferase